MGQLSRPLGVSDVTLKSGDRHIRRVLNGAIFFYLLLYIQTLTKDTQKIYEGLPLPLSLCENET